MSEEHYEEFFQEIFELEAEQDSQKARGLNDYNVFTSLLSKHDEVRLHSRFLYSFLNPEGSHYQKDLFLKKFLQVCGLGGFGLNTKEAIVYKEYANIDLYITDGIKHIIIENKIYAGDQTSQIKRYIETIYDENKNICGSDIYVLYLSLNHRHPSQESLEYFNVLGNEYLIYQEADHALSDLGEIYYKSIQYDQEILYWINAVKIEIENLTNLNIIISQYEDVIYKLYGKYRGSVIPMSKVLLKNEKNYRIAHEIINQLPKVKKDTMDEFFDNVQKQMQERLGQEWSVEIIGDFSKKYHFPLRVYKNIWRSKRYLLFGFEFDRDSYHNGYLGIIRNNNSLSIKEVRALFNDDLEKLSTELSTNSWWLDWEWFDLKVKYTDMVNEVLFNGLSVNDFSDRFIQYINIFENNGLISTINQKISTEKCCLEQ